MAGRRKAQWKGGLLPIKRGTLSYRTTDTISIPEYELVDEGLKPATRYGSELALLDEAKEQELINGLWLRMEIRDSRPQLVAIESRASGSPITTSSLRLPIDKIVNQWIREHTVRVTRDPSTGSWFGVHVTSPTGAGEIRSLAERTRDVDQEAGLRKRGRPRLTDDFLREVADKWQEFGRGASSGLAALYKVEPSTVRQWMFKARARGFAQKEE